MAIKNKTLALLVSSAQTLIRQEKISEQDKAAALLELARSLSGASSPAATEISGASPEEREESLDGAIVEFLRDNGPTSAKDVSRALNVSYSSSWNSRMRGLVELGVLQHNGIPKRGSKYFVDAKKAKRKLRAVA